VIEACSIFLGEFCPLVVEELVFTEELLLEDDRGKREFIGGFKSKTS